MTASTCLRPYQNTHTIATKRDAFILVAQHRRGRGSHILSFHVHDLFVARLASPPSSNQRQVYLRQFFHRLQRRAYRSAIPISLLKARRDNLNLLDKAIP